MRTVLPARAISAKEPWISRTASAGFSSRFAGFFDGEIVYLIRFRIGQIDDPFYVGMVHRLPQSSAGFTLP